MKVLVYLLLNFSSKVIASIKLLFFMSFEIYKGVQRMLVPNSHVSKNLFLFTSIKAV